MNLAEWMEAEGLKDAGLAERLNGKLSRSQISRIRRRKSIPPIDTAKLLESVTGIPAAEILFGEAA
jgi:transcriptional regulator with XRE-family HTH domain